MTFWHPLLWDNPTSGSITCLHDLKKQRWCKIMQSDRNLWQYTYHPASFFTQEHSIKAIDRSCKTFHNLYNSYNIIQPFIAVLSRVALLKRHRFTPFLITQTWILQRGSIPTKSSCNSSAGKGVLMEMVDIPRKAKGAAWTAHFLRLKIP